MKAVRLLILGVGLMVTLTWAVVSAQQPASGGIAPSSAIPAQGGSSPYGGFYTSASQFAFDQGQSIQLAQQYVKAEKEAEKSEIRKKLTDLLGQQFDQHVKQQQKELEDLEKQIESLRKTVKKRLDAKTTIVDRRIDQLVQEAEGLGWNAPATPRRNVFGGGLGSFGGNPLIEPAAAKPGTTKR